MDADDKSSQLSSVDSSDSAAEEKSIKEASVAKSIDQISRIETHLRNIKEAGNTLKQLGSLQAIIRHLANLNYERIVDEAPYLANAILQTFLECHRQAPSRLQLRFRKAFEDLRFTFDSYCRESPQFQNELLDMNLFQQFKSVFPETETTSGAQNAAFIPLASTNIASNGSKGDSVKRPRKIRYFGGGGVAAVPAPVDLSEKQLLLMRSGAKFPLDEILRVLIEDKERTMELAKMLPQQISEFVQEASWFEQAPLPVEINRLRRLCTLINSTGESLQVEPPTKKRKQSGPSARPMLDLSSMKGTQIKIRRSGHEGSIDTIWQSTSIRKNLRIEQIEDVLHLRDIIREKLANSRQQSTPADAHTSFSHRRPPDDVLRKFCTIEIKGRNCSLCGASLGSLSEKRHHIRLHVLRLSPMLPNLLQQTRVSVSLPLKSFGNRKLVIDQTLLQAKEFSARLSKLFNKTLNAEYYHQHLISRRHTCSHDEGSRKLERDIDYFVTDPKIVFDLNFLMETVHRLCHRLVHVCQRLVRMPTGLCLLTRKILFSV
eukprot:Gregarina_sp_Poly_1__7931@NODE_452_length_8287_cov_521_171290_g369_i0_p1_GENE_NODE_452_length_8287_cov_521_171290_g369_i0NODE_452_length_8287_cov_521_171290_g369_i0_p1_ORF_typecomplete_len544_score65_96IL31/PF15209_6/0_13_NODE_452_length_8287_cov_521_171290_g369_i041905821